MARLNIAWAFVMGLAAIGPFGMSIGGGAITKIGGMGIPGSMGAWRGPA